MAFSDEFATKFLTIIRRKDEDLIADAIREIEGWCSENLHKEQIKINMSVFHHPPYSRAICCKINQRLHKIFCEDWKIQLALDNNVEKMKKNSICFLKQSKKQNQTVKMGESYDPCDFTSATDADAEFYECVMIIIQMT